jgi:thiol-disulfide isomerase/thioredoxin
MRNSGFVNIKSNSSANRLINAANYNTYLASLEMEELNAEWMSSMRHAQKDSTWSKYIKSDGLIQKKSNFELQRLENLIQTNTDNPGVIYLLSLYPTDTDSKFFESQIENALLRFPASSDLKNLQTQYQTKKEIRYSLKKGSLIPDLAYANAEGKIIDIKDYRGKYVLIDFWASWCGPCRKSIPAIKELYETHKEKGFDVLSVSIDTNREAWLKAVHEENMPWTQVLSPDKDKTLKEFMIIGVPTLFLVDKEGKIVEKFTGFSQDLKNKVSKSFENEA